MFLPCLNKVYDDDEVITKGPVIVYRYRIGLGGRGRGGECGGFLLLHR